MITEEKRQQLRDNARRGLERITHLGCLDFLNPEDLDVADFFRCPLAQIGAGDMARGMDILGIDSDQAVTHGFLHSSGDLDYRTAGEEYEILTEAFREMIMNLRSWSS